MNNIKLELMTYNCQIGMYFSRIIQLQNGFIVYSDTVEDQSWNFFTGFNANSIEQFLNIYICAKEVFKKINRAPCFILTPSTTISNDVYNYIKSNYKNFSTSVTLLTNSFLTKKNLSSDYTFKKINNQIESNLFVNTFKTSKSQTLPGDTYESLPNYYFTALEKSFLLKSDWKFIHFISMYKNIPIGMVSACVKDNYCGLYGGGTFVEHRGKGVFTNLLNYVYVDLNKEKVDTYFGITEKGSKNEKYYNNIGWNTIFENKYYN